MISPRARLASLAAAASLAASGGALAQSSVTISGLIDGSVGQSKLPGASDTISNADSGKMTTSWFGFRGTEDLGGGLSAIFAIESFLRADEGAAGRFNGDAFWARNAWVGLNSASLGRVTLGRNTTSLFVSTLLFNAFGDSFGYSPSIRHYFTSGAVTGDTGWSDSVQYSTPSWGGFSGTLTAAAGEGSSNGHNLAATAMYFGGPFAASLSWQDVEKDAGAVALPDTETWQLGASWDFGMLKLFGQYGTVDNKTSGNSYDIAGLGATVPVGAAGKVLLQGGVLDPETGARRTTVSVGYDHFLSKRTDWYAVAMSDKIDGLSSGHSWSVGIRHRF